MKDSFEAYNKVETEALANDSLAAVKYKEVADKYKGDTAGKLAPRSAPARLCIMKVNMKRLPNTSKDSHRKMKCSRPTSLFSSATAM